MNKVERESRSSSATDLIRYLLERYGNTKAIVDALRENAKADVHIEGDDALMYDASRHEWILNSWIDGWEDYNGEWHGNCWAEETSFCCKIKDITAWDLASHLSDEMVGRFTDTAKYFTDEIKIASYSFGYYGGISFSKEFSTDSEGICWLEKEEFLKYSGCKEEYWKEKSLTEIEWLCQELDAWSKGDVYGFVVEDAVRIQGIKTYYNGEREDEPYIETRWEETDSCCGFYMDLSKQESVKYIIEEAGYKLEELVEEE
jgi:hypothetical protein